MEYLTVRETSEKWGMSIRMVNYYLNTQWKGSGSQDLRNCTELCDDRKLKQDPYRSEQKAGNLHNIYAEQCPES